MYFSSRDILVNHLTIKNELNFAKIQKSKCHGNLKSKSVGNEGNLIKIFVLSQVKQ